MLILFLKLQHYTLTFLHLVLFFFTHFQFSYFSFISISILFLYSFFYTFLPFLTPFSILLHTFLSPLFFLYAFPYYFLTFPTHCLAVSQLILLYLVFHISLLTVNIASCQATVPYCAILYLVIINFIGSSFKLLCNSALLCHSSIIY